MPELPEVETVRLGLEPRLLGRTIVRTQFGDFPGVIGERSIDQFNAEVVGRRFESLRRRGKYLIAHLDDDLALIMHLRMTGVLIVAEPATPSERFQHLTLGLDDDNELRFSDQRKFGRILVAGPDDVAMLEKRLGPEPLDDAFTADQLGAAFAGRRAPVKSALLNQELVAGLGNIYVDEALFGAGIHPLKPAGDLSKNDLERLHLAIRQVLRDALEHRGTSFSHFKDSNGESGKNQFHLLIYGKGNSGQPCPRCGGIIEKTVVGGRGTHFCPNCQT